MRRIKLYIASSLDGYIARPDGGIDWLFSDADYGYRKFIKSIDTVLMGRKTWDLSRSFADNPYPGKRVCVFSRQRGLSHPQAQFVNPPIAPFVQELRREAGKDTWLVGGGELVREFLNAGLIDDFIVSIHPIVLGAGLPLFPAPSHETRLRLVKTESFSSGLVQLQYTRAPSRERK